MVHGGINVKYDPFPLINAARGAYKRKVSLGPLTETKSNLMERFIGTDTASVELFFNIVTSGFETFIISWDQLLYP